MYNFFSKLHGSNFNILIILFSALIFRLIIANFGTLQLDHGTFIAWADVLVNGGFKNFYNGWSDYLPGYLYFLWIIGKINIIVPSFQTILFKLPAIFADIFTGYLIYKIISKYKNEKFGQIGALLYLFNPAIFANSSLWGQADSLTSLFSLFAIFVFQTNFLLSAASLAIGTLIKPQAAFVLPAILYLLIINKKSFKEIALYLFSGLFIFFTGFLPFNNNSNFFKFILERLTISSGQYPYGSINAYSFWGYFGFWKPDNITIWVGMAVSVIIILTILIVTLKKRPKAGEYLIAAISFLTTFIFMTRMHERHLLPVFAPLVITSILNPVILIPYFALSFTYMTNLSYSYYWITDNYKEIFNGLLNKFFISVNILSLLTILFTIYKKIELKIKLNFLNILNRKHFKNEKYFSTKDLSSRNTNYLLIGILLFSFFTRIYNLGLPKGMYFDEIYHTFTAKLVLHNDPKAWEWWNPNPEGFAYEWTHPPLSKLGMALGMYIFGENEFGWRVPQAIFGTLSVLLIYLLAKEIFKDKFTAILAAAVFSLDGLFLVLSRMGMNDSYVLFFSLLSIYLFLKDKTLLSAVAFGLALSSKWSAIYAFPIIFISHFVFKKKIKLSYLSFLFIPIIVYIASYGVMFATGHTWDQFIEVQKQMWWYHTNLVATHPYTSPAWSWPILLRPIYLYDGGEIDGQVARIYAFGNPAVFWFGLFSMIMSAVISFREKLKKLGFVVFAYVIFFLPWIASPRIMFLYHYLPSIPFMAIATGFVLRRFPKAIPYLLISSALLFVYFYPHWIGMRIPIKLDESYYWFSTWR